MWCSTSQACAERQGFKPQKCVEVYLRNLFNTSVELKLTPYLQPYRRYTCTTLTAIDDKDMKSLPQVPLQRGIPQQQARLVRAVSQQRPREEHSNRIQVRGTRLQPHARLLGSYGRERGKKDVRSAQHSAHLKA